MDKILFETSYLRRSRIFRGYLFESKSEFTIESSEAPRPSLMAPNDRRLDEQSIPPPRRSQCTIDNRSRIGVDGERLGLLPSRVKPRRLDGNSRCRKSFIRLGRGHPPCSIGRRGTVLIQQWHLTE